MQVILNGESLDVNEAISIEALLVRVGKSPEHVAVECNGQVVEVAEFPSLQLAAGDVLEIVHFVGGG